MKKLISYFIKYPAWPNSIKLLVFGFGLAAAFGVKSSFFPEIENRVVKIQITYPGASPEEIEKGVVNKIEENLEGIQGIERYTSNTRENQSRIRIEIERGFDVEEAIQDIKNAVNRINSFPENMEPPVISKQPDIEFAISFSISGNADIKTLKKIGKQAKDELMDIDGISQIELSGFPPEEIAIYISEKKLRAFGLTLDQVANAVRSNNIDLTGGEIRTPNEEIIIRMEAKDYYAEGLKDIIVFSDNKGNYLKLGDVAEVKDTWKEIPQQTYINGERGIIVNVNKTLGEDIIKIAEEVRKFVDDYNQRYPNFNISIVDDSTIGLNERLDMLISNGAMGAVLILLSLTIFIRLRLAFWVAIGLPFSFLGMLIFMNIAGLTINAISLFGCIVVVGILVDDAIIIAEQIFQYHEEGYKPFSAALNGTMSVLPSVFFAILTTIAAFMPFFFFAGSQGENMRDLAFVVIITVLFSLIESALILPAHLAHSKVMRETPGENSLRNKIDKILLYPRDNWYNRSLKFFMNNKIVALAIAFAITIATIGAFKGGVIGATFFPYLDSDKFEISVQMPPGTRGELTKDVLERIEKSVWEVNEELSSKRNDGKQVIKKVILNLAKGPTGLFGARSEGGSNIGTLKIVLLSAEQRNLDSYKIENMIAEKTGHVYEADRINYGEGSRFGKPVSIPLISKDVDVIVEAAEELKSGLNDMDELRDVSDNSPLGPREIRINLLHKAQTLGITNLDVIGQIRNRFFGREAQRVQRGEDEIKIWVRYSTESRNSIRKLENMPVIDTDGNMYPLKELAKFNIVRTPTVINHLNGKREVTVDANLVNQNMEVPPVLAEVEANYLNPLLKKYPEVKTAESGQQREIMKTARSARTTMTVALIIMFFLISLSFRSFGQSLIVFALIPLGFIGAAWGHLIHGMPVNMMSGYGLVALLGIIVNDSIVFINTINQFLKEGRPFQKAVFDAGINRFRPILLTTATTVLGLYPLILSTSRQATFLVPMALSVAYGLLLGSVFILIFIPVYLLYFNDIKRYIKRIYTGKMPEPEDVEPAIIEQKNLKKYFSEEDIKQN